MDYSEQKTVETEDAAPLMEDDGLTVEYAPQGPGKYRFEEPVSDIGPREPEDIVKELKARSTAWYGGIPASTHVEIERYRSLII